MAYANKEQLAHDLNDTACFESSFLFVSHAGIQIFFKLEHHVNHFVKAAKSDPLMFHCCHVRINGRVSRSAVITRRLVSQQISG